MDVLSLNGTWSLSKAAETSLIPAIVPGCVHTDLLNNGLLDYPFYRDNERKQFWVGETDWTYRRNFNLTKDFLNHERVLLRCHGLDTLATIRVNGVEIAQTDNMYRTWELDLKAHLRHGENEIEIYFAAPMPFLRQQEEEKGKLYAWSIGNERLNSGAWLRKEPCNFGWDWGPKLVTSGIWRDIELVAFDVARISEVQILQNHERPDHVTLTIKGVVERLTHETFEIEVNLNFSGETIATQTLPVTEKSFEVYLEIPSPHLWWPNGMGEQALYDLTVTLCHAATQLDQQVKRIGLRTLRLERHADEWGESFYFSANGVPFFAKGANWIPADPFAARLDRQDYAALIRSAADANMNMLRAWGGGIYEANDFYDLCDEYGLVVWQDFMFACGTYPAYDAEFMRNVEAEARDNVRRLRHHPSIALWCGNNELEQGLVKDEWTETSMSWEDYSKLFDVLLRDVTHELDPQRDYWPGSPHSPLGDRNDWRNPDWGDTHLWEVWHGRKPFEWYRTCYHRFASEFGFQSFPEPQTVLKFTTLEDRNITSYVMEYHQRSGIGNQTIIHYMLDWFRMPTSFEGTLWLSQILQGMAMKYAIEHWRRNMPRSMGALYWQLNDIWPGPSWSSMDSTGRWKTLHYMARKFYAPLLVSGVEDVANGTAEIYVTTDLMENKQGLVKWTVTDVAGSTIEQGQLDVTLAPRQSLKVGTLDLSAQLATHSAQNLLLWLELVVDGRTVSDNLVTFARPKHLSLPIPEIKLNIAPLEEGGFAVTLVSDQSALWTWLELPTDARLADNFVHLRPGHPYTIHVYPTTPMSLTGLQAQLKVMSLVDTYQSASLEFAF
ncbi:MAG: glycoside hydrolase family 2 protein [Chloroflexi bacterium]|nr:glycoside hydrolase family 2 protein [Chloroflexota bacterium]